MRLLQKKYSNKYDSDMRVCHFCKSKIEKDLYVGRTTACPSCGKDLRICCNCQFYKKGSHWDCMETITEPVRDKERGNFCDYFVFSSPKKDKNNQDEKERARTDFNRLFGE